MSVLLEKRSNGVAVITLNRPQVLNALDVPAKADYDERVRLAVLDHLIEDGLNDDATHYLLIQRASEALATGENPIDHWVPELEFGFPWFLPRSGSDRSGRR